ncbi:MAG: ATP-dependent DNA helicase RecG [Clostridia bacterium]|nr:ATP-dependent DNA helicase RecG [Clostridia bacterium]
MPLSLTSSVSTMRGIGEARAAALASLGIYTVEDLIRHYPRGYQRRGDVRTVSKAVDLLRSGGGEMPISLMLTVSAEPSYHVIRRGMSVLRFRAFDETGVCEITYFNQNFLRDTFHTGSEFRFFGRVTLEGRTLKMTSPIWEPVVPERSLPSIVPVYKLASGLSQKVLSTLIRDALTAVLSEITETLPADVMARSSLCTLPFALRNIHMPDDTDSLFRARRRLVFEEYFQFGLMMAAAGKPKTDVPAPKMELPDFSPLLRQLPYTLTGAQTRSIGEIAHDLASGVRMNRILLGDVGSGKTIVAAAAAFIAAKNGFQTAIMAPTEILAAQHARELTPLLQSLGFRVLLLTGSVTAAQKRKLYAEIESGAEIAIGTHALISAGVTFRNLGLVIEDEQHRFGVAQRAALAEKGETAHMLTMSATPIPRSLSLVAYGGLAVSRLDEMPPGRQKIDTFVVNETYRARLNGFIRKEVEAGHQVYIVCPAVEENPEAKKKASDDPEELTDLLLTEEAESTDRPPLKAAVEYAGHLSDTVFSDLTVGFVHGRMKSAEKDRIMRAFCEGEISILVSTTVIEVGVNVPNATLMIVENAERFGLAQLHQLRGRVGRGSAKSYCVLVSDAKGETAKRRLGVLRRSNDGFEIAEEDLALRGPGEFVGTGGAVHQHGKTMLPIPAESGDYDLLSEAMAEARLLLDRDPALSQAENAPLRDAVFKMRESLTNTLN